MYRTGVSSISHSLARDGTVNKTTYTLNELIDLARAYCEPEPSLDRRNRTLLENRLAELREFLEWVRNPLPAPPSPKAPS